MSKKNFLPIICCFLLATVVLSLRADDAEVEIQLVEIVNMGNIIGDIPDDTPVDDDNTPTRPNQFRATIAGRLLSVTADTPNTALMTVRNSAGSVVLSQPVVGFAASQLSQSGSYSIEIQCSNLLLVGQFVAQ